MCVCVSVYVCVCVCVCMCVCMCMCMHVCVHEVSSNWSTYSRQCGIKEEQLTKAEEVKLE